MDEQRRQGIESYTGRLYQILISRFDENELKTLCFHLKVDYDDLPGEGKANKARELISYVKRHGDLRKLVEIGKRLRSDVAWDDLLYEKIEIPFVTAAMTHNEAIDLFSGTVFDDADVAPIEGTNFQKFRELLQEQGFADFSPNYGEKREDWRCHAFQEFTAHEIISDTVALINQRLSRKPYLPAVSAKFFSTHFFADDENTRLETWDLLGRLGCVIIIDAVSMFHPKLRNLLRHSEMGSNERVAILVLSPVDSTSSSLNRLIESEIGTHMQRAFARFSRHLDRLCEIGVGDFRSLRRWLFAILPETAMIVGNQRPNPSNIREIQKQVGEPVGIERLIFGYRGGP